VESLQAWGFALRATTPQVAFGYGPSGRSVFLVKKIEYITSTFDIRYSIFIRHQRIRFSEFLIKDPSGINLVAPQPAAELTPDT